MNKNQKDDINNVFTSVKGAGVLDFVTAWYILAGKYVSQSTNLKQDAHLYLQTLFLRENKLVFFGMSYITAIK